MIETVEDVGKAQVLESDRSGFLSLLCQQKQCSQSRGIQPAAMGKIHPSMAMNAAQHNIVNLLKTL